ncbi:nucleotidyltransferase family protein [Paenibacillus sp. F6_3S_P_1C]|uniref:Nucleotidyltransferase family protein n=1 Tax=Paenibacillus vandeheii TaxID=3035917 RepID=A0ABT8JHZ0_9BACL|nr:nucleotidyltransferase family protein [Paenibacillus vandeheii]MDN4604171.1 nucleotidyltransferase family protein [Paenibacillus vandeheii]
MHEEKLIQAITEHEQLMHDLRWVRSLDLPQCYIGAGYIRNYIWDVLHGYSLRELHSDIDVVYYDTEDMREERDLLLEQRLREETGNSKWSVKNQARMHLRNGNEPYQSTEDALRYWPEIVTAIGVRLDEQDQLGICAPHGLEDLYGLIVRQSHFFKDAHYYNQRVEKKYWQQQWPKLTIIRS